MADEVARLVAALHGKDSEALDLVRYLLSLVLWASFYIARSNLAAAVEYGDHRTLADPERDFILASAADVRQGLSDLRQGVGKPCSAG